jgi:hypothetical protein
VEEFILLNGHFPSVSEFNLIKHSLSDDSIAKSITVDNQSDSTGNITLKLNSNTGITEDQYIQYTRDEDRNWGCSSDLDTNILPAQCKSLAGESE